MYVTGLMDRRIYARAWDYEYLIVRTIEAFRLDIPAGYTRAPRLTLDLIVRHIADAYGGEAALRRFLADDLSLFGTLREGPVAHILEHFRDDMFADTRERPGRYTLLRRQRARYLPSAHQHTDLTEGETRASGSNWIGVVLQDQSGRPVANVAVTLTFETGLQKQAKLGADGRLHLRGLPAVDSCEVTLHIDASLWKEPDFACRTDTVGERHEHVVVGGDCLTSIAAQYGLIPEAIWEDDANTLLRQTRSDSAALCGGDVISIPPQQHRTAQLPLNKEHALASLRVWPRVVIQLEDALGAWGAATCVLHVDGERFDGALDDRGKLDIEVPPHARSGLLVVGSGADQVVVPLQIGGLTPMATTGAI